MVLAHPIVQTCDTAGVVQGYHCERLSLTIRLRNHFIKRVSSPTGDILTEKLPMKSRIRMVLFGFCVMGCPKLHADVLTWDGGGGDSNWATAANWDTDSVPGAGDTVNISDGSTVTSLTGNLPSTLTINLTGNSTLTRPNSVIRLNNANINVASGSGLTGNGFWDLGNADFTFEDGAIVTAAQWELKGTNSFTFNLSASGFTALTPSTFRNDSNNAATPATLISNDTFAVDMANYTGGTGIITLMDFAADAEGMDNTAFQNANLNILNAGSYTANLQWNDTTEAIELNISAAAVPEPSSFALIGLSLVCLGFRHCRRAEVS